MGVHSTPNIADTMNSLILILSSVVAVSMAYPYPMPVPVAIAYPQSVPSYVAPPKFEERADVGLDRSGHHGYDEHLGRVKMQIYRGPTTGKGYEYFAPWGYYNTQPPTSTRRSTTRGRRGRGFRRTGSYSSLLCNFNCYYSYCCDTHTNDWKTEPAGS